MRLVLETHLGRFELAKALHVDVLVCVDQDIGDGRILEERFDRAKAGQLIEHFLNEIPELTRIERHALGEHIVGDELVHLLAQLRPRHPLDMREIELVDQLAMQLDLGVEQFRPLQRRRRRHLGVSVPVYRRCRRHTGRAARINIGAVAVGSAKRKTHTPCRSLNS